MSCRFSSFVSQTLITAYNRRTNICYIDTDSIHVAVHSPRLIDNIRPDKLELFLSRVNELFEDETSKLTQAGRFKQEFFVAESYYRSASSCCLCSGQFN